MVRLNPISLPTWWLTMRRARVMISTRIGIAGGGLVLAGELAEVDDDL
jgi:hypothetical protein